MYNQWYLPITPPWIRHRIKAMCVIIICQLFVKQENIFHQTQHCFPEDSRIFLQTAITKRT